VKQFQKPPPKFPKKAIILAVVLFVLGGTLLVVGSLLLTGYIDAKVSTSSPSNTIVKLGLNLNHSSSQLRRDFCKMVNVKVV